MLYSYKGILLSNKKEQSVINSNNMAKFQVEWKKLDRSTHFLFPSHEMLAQQDWYMVIVVALGRAGQGWALTGKGYAKPSGVIEIFYTLIEMWVTRVYAFVKTHQT